MLSLGYRLRPLRSLSLDVFYRLKSDRVSRRPARIVNLASIQPLIDSPANTKTVQPSSLEDEPRLSSSESTLRERHLKFETVDIENEASDHKVSEEDEKKLLPRIVELKSDIQLSKYMLLAKSRTRRRKAGIMLLEGKKLVKDALLSGAKLKSLYFSRRTDLAELSLPSYEFSLFKLPYRYFKKWSDVCTSPGVLGFFEIPTVDKTVPDPSCLPLTVICDSIRDPGNMGALLRVLAGVGCSKILVTKGCVDIWEPKVLRSACGGHFRVPIHYDLEWNNISDLIEDDASVFLADTNPALETATQTSGADGDLSSEEEEEDGSCSSNELEESNDEAVKSFINLPSLPYYRLKFKRGQGIVLIVSNESVGISQKAVDFTSSRQGVKVHIPLCGEVDSLNVVTASSIIAFELRRQSFVV